MRILIVEDNPKSRKLLLYLLQERFMSEAKFREAQDLKSAFEYLRRWKEADKEVIKNGEVPEATCIILDLSLPDSAGKETFLKINKLHPEIPIVVMTSTNDRELAESMVDLGAQDYIIKNFTNEEEIFRRVSFAIRRHNRTVSVPPKAANSIHQLESNKAQLLNAHQSGEHKAVASHSVEILSSMTDLIKKTFLGMQELKINQEKNNTNQEHMIDDIKKINDEIFGTGGRRAMRSELDIMGLQISDLKLDYQSLETKVNESGKEKKEVEKEVHSNITKITMNRHDNIVKIIVTILGLIGTIVTIYFGIKYGVKP